MDAAGKDSMIKHVMSGINPQGCQVHSYKLLPLKNWNTIFCGALRARSRNGAKSASSTGRITRKFWWSGCTLNCSRERKFPPQLCSEDIWQKRFEDINSFERYLTRNGIVVLKFFLHLSKKEQKKRFLERLEHPDKNWKFSMSDALERQHWEKYMRAYEDMIRNTSTKHAPWYVVPADHKWFTRLVVAEAAIEAMEKLDLSFPKVDAEKRKELKAARAALEREG